ncbi:hypothetical protein [Streptomyces sp. Y1]|uniref:Pectate lyase n=1 Tax=Streptomyces sp. Y1 TaxID=3238634 RepID=A0AB39TXK5_9ACTN
MAVGQRVETWYRAAAVGVATLAVTGALAAPAGAATQSGGPATQRVGASGGVIPRDHPGGRPVTRRPHHWIVKFQAGTVATLNRITEYTFQRTYRQWTVAITGNNVQGRDVTIYTKITSLDSGEGGIVGGTTAPSAQVVIAHNNIVASGDVNVITLINNIQFINPQGVDVLNGPCTARVNAYDAVKAQLACTMG